MGAKPQPVSVTCIANTADHFRLYLISCFNPGNIELDVRSAADKATVPPLSFFWG